MATKKKSRWKKPKPAAPKQKDKPNAADQAAVEAALAGAGDAGNAGAAPDPNAAGSAAPPANAPMTNAARMISRYGAGSQ